MGFVDDLKATAKNIEGKAQETAGNITGDKADQLADKAKQAQASNLPTVIGTLPSALQPLGMNGARARSTINFMARHPERAPTCKQTCWCWIWAWSPAPLA